MGSHHILIIDDDTTLRSAIENFVKKLGHRATGFGEVAPAIKKIGPEVDLILSDVRMQGLSGLDLLQHVRKNHPHIPLILMTGFGTIEKAVEAMKKGAYDFLVKPFSLNILQTAIDSAIMDYEVFKNEEETSLKIKEGETTQVDVRKVSERFVTNDLKMREIVSSLRRVAPSKATVLIQGESGTGKELVAHMIHEFSPRAQRIFVAINCAAMPDTLLESELFGHEKGSFTGAVARQIGKFELSNNGTILLDEISEMSLPMQTKLLRVLQEGEIYRVGGTKPLPLNLRVIATTNRDLFSYMKQGHFREDLFYRLNVIPITLPPLRDRGGDVLLLAREFIQEFSVLHGRPVLELAPLALQKISTHSWYGNIRELRNTMERAVLVGGFENVGEVSSPKWMESAGLEVGGEPVGSLGEVEKMAILRTLELCHGNRTRTAHKLGISLRTLRNKLKNYNIVERDMIKEVKTKKRKRRT